MRSKNDRLVATGKSVSLNAMINSLLYKVSPDMVRFLIIDPKRIELSIYKDMQYICHNKENI